MPAPRPTSLYDAVPYPGQAFAQTHPDRLATHAALFGLEAPPPAACRLLEIGCGDGGNLLPMAVALPEATFVGIDPSAHAIARAQEVAADLGLTNIRFEEVGVEAFDAAAGSFDYVVSHGVFSWVPDDVRTQLLALTAHALAPRGVEFVSYNALPGARVPHTLRELLAIMLAGIEDPPRRIAEARRLLTLLAGGDGAATPLGGEAAALLGRPDALLFHDVLAPVNEPFLFSTFAARAAAHGLQYLAEANIVEMHAGGIPAELGRELFAGDDVVRQEQILDHLRLRRFRQTLLCHADVEVDRTPHAEAIARLAVSSPARASVEDPARPERVTFWAPGGSRLEIEDAVVVALLRRAAAAWPAAVEVESALTGAGASPQAFANLCAVLLRCYATTGLLQLHVHPPAPAPAAGERPLASPLARIQARDGGEIATLRHATIPLDDELLRALLVLLDGTRDRAALADELAGVAGVSREELAGGRLDAGLRRLARSALLLA